MRLTKSHVISGALAVALVGATGVAWYFAAQARTPAQRAEETAEPEDSVVTVRVDQDQLIDTLEFSAELDRTGEIEVQAPAASEGVETALASRLPMEAGDEVNAGNVLLEVSGRPMIALPGEVPAYRDLEEGDTGPDVEQLQKALAWIYDTPVTGSFDERTAGDLTKLYDDIGYEVPTTGGEDEAGDDGFDEGADDGADEDGEEGAAEGGEEAAGHGQTDTAERVSLPAGEAVFLPDLPVQVGEVKAKQSAPVEGTVMTLVSGDWKLEAELTDEEASELSKYGDEAELVYGSGPLEGLDAEPPEIDVREVEEEGDDFSEEEAGTTEKPFAVFDFDESDMEDSEDLTPGTDQTVELIRARSDDDALIVPLSALWTDSEGRNMLTVVADDGTERHLEADIVLRHEGRGVVEPVDGELADGDEVVVAWRDRGEG